MKKLLLALMALPSLVFSQTTINFDNPAYWNNGAAANFYGSHTYVENGFSFTSNKVMREDASTNANNDGFANFIGVHSLRLRNEADSWVQFKIETGGVGEFGFMARRWDSSPFIDFSVKVSADNGVSWTSLASVTNETVENQSGFRPYSDIANVEGSNILIRVERVNGERMMLDNFYWYPYSAAATPCSITALNLSALTCDNNGTIDVTTDDRVKFTLNVEGTSTGANGYTVSTDAYDLVGTATGVFGQPQTFMLEAGSVAGNDFTITVTSNDSTSCFLSSAVITNETVECSTPPASCVIEEATVSSIICNTGSDINNSSDDFLELTLLVNGQVISANGYTITSSVGTLSATTGSYGTDLALTISGLGSSNDTLTIVDADDAACTYTVVVTNPGVCSQPSTIVATPATAIAFTQTIPVPSANKTVSVSGTYLTEDITITASTGFEVSLNATADFAATTTLSQVANTVAATTVYVRANATAVGSFTGTLTMSSANATDVVIDLTNVAQGYTPYLIDQINGINSNGVGDSVGVKVEVAGIVQCRDFNVGAGYNFVIVDASNKGINIYSNGSLNGYTNPVGGDSVIVRGTVGQYNGMLQITAASVTLVSQGNEQITPIAVTELNEETENYPVKLVNVTLVPGQTDGENPLENWPTSNYNPLFTDGVNQFAIRAKGTALEGQPLPWGPVTISGIGSQFDNSNPYTSGYQLLVCGDDAVELICEGAHIPNANINVNGKTLSGVNVPSYTWQWINCEDESPIAGATNRQFTPSTPGEYAVIIDNGICTTTSECFIVDDLGFDNVLASSISVYPNPVDALLTIKNYSAQAASFVITDINGKVVVAQTSMDVTTTVNTSEWNHGIYFVTVYGENKATHTMKVVK